MRLLVCGDPLLYLTNITLRRPHPTVRHTRPLKSLHPALIFSTSSLLCSIKSDHLPNRLNTAPGPTSSRFSFASFSFYLFTGVVLNPHQVSNSGPAFGPPHGGFHHNWTTRRTNAHVICVSMKIYPHYSHK